VRLRIELSPLPSVSYRGKACPSRQGLRGYPHGSARRLGRFCRPDRESSPLRRRVGGWGSLKGLSAVALRENPGAIELGEVLLRQNKHGGFMCVSCAWGKPEKPNPAEFCENGAKATAWDLTRHRCTPEFFAEHTLTELRTWPDFDLEHQGRLTTPRDTILRRINT